jgi:protein tyrosine phosphatase (PTP) superfamily phosphohydrolase (DUF442 family)
MKRVFANFILPLLALAFCLVEINLGAAASTVLPGIHNFFRATTNVFSGSQPEGEASFAALAQLGVKTIISVDGAKPEAKLAAKHGLRYVHLPLGYDGIPTNRVAELAKAATVLPGPMYVHCHHGKHRGPAAVSVICMADAGWTAAQAVDFMHQAGTGAEYQGLYRAAREFQTPTAQQLAAVSTNFPSVARTSSLVEAMVAADRIYENLKLVQAADWRTPAKHPDLAPRHEALMLVEQFREIERTSETVKRSPDFQTRLSEAVTAATVLHDQLSSPLSNRQDAAFKRVGQSCAECHTRHRNS